MAIFFLTIRSILIFPVLAATFNTVPTGGVSKPKNTGDNEYNPKVHRINTRLFDSGH